MSQDVKEGRCMVNWSLAAHSRSVDSRQVYAPILPSPPFLGLPDQPSVARCNNCRAARKLYHPFSAVMNTGTLTFHQQKTTHQQHRHPRNKQAGPLQSSQTGLEIYMHGGKLTAKIFPAIRCPSRFFVSNPHGSVSEFAVVDGLVLGVRYGSKVLPQCCHSLGENISEKMRKMASRYRLIIRWRLLPPSWVSISCLAVTGAGAVAIRSTCPYGITNVVHQQSYGTVRNPYAYQLFQRHNHTSDKHTKLDQTEGNKTHGIYLR